MKYLLPTLLIGVFLTVGKLGYDLHVKVHDRKEKMEDFAELNMVNYELFNMQLWKEKALEIVNKKISEFEISQETFEVLDDQIQLYLNAMYKQYFDGGELGNIILTEVKKSGQVNPLFMNIIEQQVPVLLKSIDLKPRIPELSDQLVAEIKQNEPLIRQYMQMELLRLVMDNETREYRDRREVLYAKYNMSSLNETDVYLKGEVERLDSEIKSQILIFILTFLLFLILSIVIGKSIGFRPLIASLTVGSILLLILGVTMPMIDIDARLNSFEFNLFDEPITFEEQIIYYQSKSIVEVTQTLWRGGTWDLKLVGILVIMFSIIFPFFKLMLSGLYLFVDKVRKNNFAKGVIFHLGKWSMADVFVVAIFMAYIGFYGIISTQLNSISTNQGGFAIETINYSRLAPGAFFFTSYTILSIGISILINRFDDKGEG